ncbi:conserved Plasmodium protein, unknown function [Plasmodium berghei]|uniref:Uncharacterized protein n=2 Tax=Plasmodium berghei TaxID=5821 RepID=A0A509AL91_PLABA|nr:conserved Plasmodium protein, unknown function [Plasmodium berghei ANKA]CXI35649.1 conserved Plasmodium protein, unknown function [Plasmodium berghei]SCM21526.1 conserved Plasmodium protein, unknown function [Plasmodium berghei]SCN24726.1 conserved Plasmodium protein, unknown function [Plasmodium berghei]SCO59867.1 conserved Plasmodium protein, unknown function [Plasmodium berghei]SCO61181.1 conserved Plasmodium protein, unknown function [Plasmodium berghei]|eukprot:XP_034421264.1 conserved Plasmodium protein, unknown function [Plasmodium berghei ANKA]
MEERTKTRIKRVMESPYSIDITPLDQDKSSKILKLLFEVINKDKSLANLFLRHDEIKDGLDHNEVRAIILIKTVQYEKFYKHIPIIASLKNVHFVLIEKEYIESSEFNCLNNPSLIGIRKAEKKNNELSNLHEQIHNLTKLIDSYYTPINIPYLFNNTNYINTKFKVEKVKGKHYDKNLSRKEKKKIRKSIKKNNI